MFYSFQCTNFVHPWLNLFLNVIIFWRYSRLNCFVDLIFGDSLVVYRTAIDFYVLILHSALLLMSFGNFCLSGYLFICILKFISIKLIMISSPYFLISIESGIMSTPSILILVMCVFYILISVSRNLLILLIWKHKLLVSLVF